MKLQDLRDSWSLEDLYDAHDALDVIVEVETQSRKSAEEQARSKKR